MRFNLISILWNLLLSIIISVPVICLPFSALGDQNLGDAVKQVFNKKAVGDFDKMVENRGIRVLVPYSKTFYFLDGAAPKGATYDMLKLFEKHLNKKLKTKHLEVHLFIIPTPRDRLIPSLAEGLGERGMQNAWVLLLLALLFGWLLVRRRRARISWRASRCS